MSKRGIRIAKEGFDISSAKPEDLYADVSTPLLKVAKFGSGSQRFRGVSTEQYTIVIPHNLGYVPFFLFFMDRNPGSDRRMVGSSEQSPLSTFTNISCFIDRVTPTELRIFAGVLGGTPEAGEYGYNFFIYYDRVSFNTAVEASQ